MKKNVVLSFSMVVAALAVLSCAKEVKESPIEKDPAGGITINVLSGSDATRTMAVDGDIPTIQWVNTDKVMVFEVVDGVEQGIAESDAAVIDGEGRASFSTTLDWEDAEGSAYQYSAVYPSESVAYYENQFYLVLPAEQALVGNNFSEDSDILFSTPLDHGSSRAADGEDVMFSFRRLGTVVRLRLSGILAGENIRQVTLQAPTNVAGAIVYDPVTSTVDPKSVYDAYSSDTIVLTVDGVEATGDDVVWFRVMCDDDWAAGEKFNIEVITDKNVYKKEVTLPGAIKFPDGGVTKFGVGLAASQAEALNVPCAWDFEDGADDWTFIDSDGDGFNWFTYGLDGYGHSGTNFLASESFDNSYGALEPDNWAFTPPVQLTEDNYLSFWVRALDTNWPEEHYAVYLTLGSPYGTPVELMPETVYPYGQYVEVSGLYQRYVIRIPEEYENETVCIGFRHFNSYDQYWLLIDDVEIVEGNPIKEPTANYEDYLGEWADGRTKYVIEPKVEGVSYSITGFSGQNGNPVEALFEDHRLVVYEQVVASDDESVTAFQGSDGYFPDYPWVSPSVIFKAVYDEDEDVINIAPSSIEYYMFIYYDAYDQMFDYDYATIPAVLTRYVPDTTTYIYYEDFESGDISAWTLIDANNDGFNWELSDESGFKTYSGSYALTSASYDNNFGPLEPDNWVFTPAIELTSDNYLSFWMCAQDPNWPEEHFAAYIIDSAPTSANLESCTVLVGETQMDGNGYHRYVAKIPSSFDGKTVYFGFRHFNCYDMFRLNLDDVGITEGAISTSAAPARPAPAAKAVQSAAPVMQLGKPGKQQRIPLKSLSYRKEK